MENFSDFENKSYVKARHVEYTFKDRLIFVLTFLSALLKVALVLILETCTSFLQLFKRSKPKDISGQVALVTGGANGLGRAIALRLAEEKCKVVIIDLNLAEAQKTAEEIAEKFKVPTAAYKVDVSNFESLQWLKEEIENTLGCVDILVNNAGILSKISLREGQPSDIQKVIDVNLTSHFWTVRTFIGKMIENKRGHVVAISSIGGKMSFPLACAYVATKFGVNGFMRALYDELCIDDEDEFIKTTTVFPSFINTRKELSDILDTTKELAPRMSPTFVANKVVEGMLEDKMDITLPALAWIMPMVNWLPRKTYKFAKKTFSGPLGHLKMY